MLEASSAVTRSPNEILSEIFEWLSVYQNDLIRGNLWIDGQRYYIDTARLVCRQWNSVIINYGPLWRYIRLLYYSENRLLMHLQRSERADTKLVVDISFDKVIWNYRPDPMNLTIGQYTEIVKKRLCDLLSHHVERIEELRVNSYYGGDASK